MPDTLLRKSSVHLLAIAVLGLIAYSNTLYSPFHFDDIGSIVENPIVKDLGFFSFSEPTREEGLEFHNYLKRRYIGYLTFALNYRVHGMNVTGYHIANLAIHIANAFLVYFLIVFLFRTPFLEVSQLRMYSRHIAVVTALLFVSHPVQTQAVTYIVQRLTSLATMFYMASLLAYVKARLTVQGTRSYIIYTASLLFAVLAMKTKEIAFTLPLLITLFEFSFFAPLLPSRNNGGAKGMRRALFIIPFLLTIPAMLLTVIEPDKPLGESFVDIGEVKGVEDISRHDYMVTELRVVVTYLRLLMLPIGQNLDYDYPVLHSFFDPQVLLSFIFLLIVIGFGVYLHFRSSFTDHALRVVAFGIFWFFLALSIESSIIPLHPIYEHRAYLPSVGVFSSFATLAFFSARKWQLSRLPMLTIFMAIILAL
jgi:hypothetical protein